MKKTVGLLFVLCCMSNIRSMQLPESEERVMATKAMTGEISADEYVFYIASLSDEYAYKLRVLRDTNERYYSDVFLQQVRKYLYNCKLRAVGDSDAYDQVITMIPTNILLSIDHYYTLLRDIEYGRHS